MSIPQLLAFFDMISAPPPPTLTGDLPVLEAGFRAVQALTRQPEWTDEEFRDKQQLAAQIHWVSVPW